MTKAYLAQVQLQLRMQVVVLLVLLLRLVDRTCTMAPRRTSIGPRCCQAEMRRQQTGRPC